jgi:hypothetical protein
MAFKTNQCQLNRRQAIAAYRSCYIPAILYSLSAVSLDQIKINTIQQKATTAFLRKSGYDMHFPRKVVYGTEKYGGLGYLQLYVESCGNKIISLVSHILNNTMLGKMMPINLNWTQTLSGVGTPILENNNIDITYITDNSYEQICSFNKTICAKIVIKNSWTPTAKRETDEITMDCVAAQDIPKNKKN